MYFLISSVENLLSILKKAAQENVEKVDSFHIYILASTWTQTNSLCEPHTKKNFRQVKTNLPQHEAE